MNIFKFVTLFFFTFLQIHLFGNDSKTNVIANRLHNIELMQSVFKNKYYKGYDIIIISSTTSEEAEFQQKMLEEVFTEASKKKGRNPIILSVVDPTEGGQLIGTVYTWLRAEEKMREKLGTTSLLDFIKQHHLKVAVFHNGGKGERFSPLTQSLGNSRGSQKLVGCIQNAEGKKFELDVLLGVILQCSSFAKTNYGTHIDTFWTSQIAFGSIRHDQLIRSNYGLDKFLVTFSKTNLVPQNIADFGTAALTKEGRLKAFYGNKRFASRKGNEYVIDTNKIQHELFEKGDAVAYDFGSFSTSLEMWQLIINYWKMQEILELGARTKIKRDIDPHFIQPFIRFLYGLNDLANRDQIDQKLPQPKELVTIKELEKGRNDFIQTVQSSFPEAFSYIWEDINHEKDSKKKEEGIACLNEVIEFYLLNRLTPTFKNLKQVFGYIDLGKDIQWFRYRRPIDIMNEKFEMLTDLLGKKIEAQLNGEISLLDTSEELIERSHESRLMRGITASELVQFVVNGKSVVLTLDEIKAGKNIEGVFIKNSIVQNCDLSKGSSIENSVLNNVIGKVICKHSYIESTIVPLIEAQTSVVHHVVDAKSILAEREVVSDVFKSRLDPPYHGRMKAPIGYDPKGMQIDFNIKYFIEKIPYTWEGNNDYSDKTARTEDGRFTFEQIREISPHRTNDKTFRESLEIDAKEAVAKSRL